MLRRFPIAIAALVLAGLVSNAHAQQGPSNTLFYTHPAREWNQALPLGNGRLGAMVFGNVNGERIQLNENSLWMGGPRDTNNPDALKHLAEVRRLLFAGLPVEAYAVAEKYSMGRPFRLESYQSLGDLRLTFEHEGTPADYRLELDIDSAIVRLTYRLGTVRYTREVFASHPAQAIVMRVSADAPGKITVSTWIDRPQDATTEVAGNDRLNLVGALAGGKGLSFLASVKILADGGRLEAYPERIFAEQTNAVTLIVAAATSYRGNDHRASVERALSAASATPYEKLKSDHVADHQKLFRRVALRLDNHEDTKTRKFVDPPPTDERLERVKNGETDLGLEALYFQFGRYLLIASSRPGGLPANLQGLWNDSMFPPWDSDYHLNINLQMNYWPAEVTNLAELHQPLFDYLESLREPGRKTARVHYGANGFVAHHISDVWGFTTPGDRPRSGLWPTGAAWLTQHLWEHYLFNPDRAFLAKAYPVMKEAAEFFLDYLVEDPRSPGRLVSGPSVSPENRYRLPSGQVGILSMGPSMDHQIITGLFTQVIRASEILGVDARVSRACRGDAKEDPAACRSAGTARFRSGPRTTTSPIRDTATSRNCSRCIRAIRSRCTARRSSRAPRARPSSGVLRTAAGTRAGAARGSSTSGRVSRTANRRTPTIRRCWRNRRCRTCGICIRRFRLTATSEGRRVSPRCCCRVTTAPFTFCRRHRAPGQTASSPACARGAV